MYVAEKPVTNAGEQCLVVDRLASADEAQWDAFVRQNLQAVPYHMLGWREIIARTYGYRPHYLVARQGEQIVGVMPLYEVHSWVQGHHFTTLPGGICAGSQEIAQALVAHARQLVASTQARSLAIRDAGYATDDPALTTLQTQCTVAIDMTADMDEMWQRHVRPQLRTYIRRARDAGVEARFGTEQLDEFYCMFSEFLHDYGTPVFPAGLLRNTIDVLGEAVTLLGIWHEGKMIGGMFCLRLGDTLYAVWGASLHRYLRLHPNYVIYWTLMGYAQERGCRRVDMGRSEIGSGQHQFKLGWPSKEYPVYQQYYLNGAQRPPISAADAAEGQGRMMVRAWQRLPLGLTRVLGPVVRRQIPFV